MHVSPFIPSRPVSSRLVIQCGCARAPMDPLDSMDRKLELWKQRRMRRSERTVTRRVPRILHHPGNRATGQPEDGPPVLHGLTKTGDMAICQQTIQDRIDEGERRAADRSSRMRRLHATCSTLQPQRINLPLTCGRTRFIRTRNIHPPLLCTIGNSILFYFHPHRMLVRACRLSRRDLGAGSRAKRPANNFCCVDPLDKRTIEGF